MFSYFDRASSESASSTVSPTEILVTHEFSRYPADNAALPQHIYPAVSAFPNPRATPAISPPTLPGGRRAIYADAMVLPCSHTPAAFCPSHAQARVRVPNESGTIFVGATITIIGIDIRTLQGPYRGTITSVVRTFQDAHLLHVAGTSHSSLESCLILAVPPDNVILGCIPRLKQRLSSVSFLHTFGTLPETVSVLYLPIYPHKSHSRFKFLRRWHTAISDFALWATSRISGLRQASEMPVSLSTPVLAPAPDPPSPVPSLSTLAHGSCVSDDVALPSVS
ncbi:hypothetical protein EIP86_002449 [Pleurotus ostreatoroseus]|nr:hypothetical protein EIP86_002449 [Pleurotus ostreatoroseus]